jgi:hypothetical protein
VDCVRLGGVSVLSSREWATVFWLLVLLCLVLAKPELRRSMVGVLRAFLAWKVLAIVVVVAVWLSLLVVAGRAVGLWNPGLWKDTVVWFVASGIVLGFASLRATKEGAFFKSELKKLLGVSVLIQFVMNLYTFHFLVEVPLQALLVPLFAVSVYAAHQGEHAQAKRLVDGTIGVIGCSALAATIWGIVDTWGSLDMKQKLLELAFSVWVPLLMLPLVYGVALVMVYELCFIRIGFRVKRPLGLREKRQVVLGTRARLATAKRFSSSPTHLLAFSKAVTYGERKAALSQVRVASAEGLSVLALSSTS